MNVVGRLDSVVGTETAGTSHEFEVVKGKKKVKVGFVYSASCTANQNSALYNLGSGS